MCLEPCESHFPGTVQVTAAALQALSSLRELIKLELVSSTVFKPQDLQPLSCLSHLRHLDIGNVMYITKAILQVEPTLPQSIPWSCWPRTCSRGSCASCVLY